MPQRRQVFFDRTRIHRNDTFAAPEHSAIQQLRNRRQTRSAFRTDPPTLVAPRTLQFGSGVGFAPGGALLELGTHPIADALGQLGLPKRALFSMHTEHMHGRFEAPEKL